jgi:hypothetical protein
MKNFLLGLAQGIAYALLADVLVHPGVLVHTVKAVAHFL